MDSPTPAGVVGRYRKAWTQRLKPGMAAEYQAAHGAIWPEVLAMFYAAGIKQFVIYLLPPDQLFLYAEFDDQAAWDSIPAQDACKRWWKEMERFVDFKAGGAGEANVPDATALDEMWYLAASTSKR